MVASPTGYFQIVERILVADDNVYAVAASELERSLSALISAPGKSKEKCRFQFSALSLSSKNGQIEVTKRLLVTGAYLANKMLGAQVLVAAAREGQMRVTELLLAENMDVNTLVSPFSVTPLWKASEHDYLDVVELLLAAGADYLALCRQKTALEIA
jgi:ankyrin repeat protein